jgi:hypothetical protein
MTPLTVLITVPGNFVIVMKFQKRWSAFNQRGDFSSPETAVRLMLYLPFIISYNNHDL